MPPPEPAVRASCACTPRDRQHGPRRRRERDRRARGDAGALPDPGALLRRRPRPQRHPRDGAVGASARVLGLQPPTQADVEPDPRERRAHPSGRTEAIPRDVPRLQPVPRARHERPDGRRLRGPVDPARPGAPRNTLSPERRPPRPSTDGSRRRGSPPSPAPLRMSRADAAPPPGVPYIRVHPRAFATRASVSLGITVNGGRAPDQPLAAGLEPDRDRRAATADVAAAPRARWARSAWTRSRSPASGAGVAAPAHVARQATRGLDLPPELRRGRTAALDRATSRSARRQPPTSPIRNRGWPGW